MPEAVCIDLNPMGWDDPRLKTYPALEERLRVAERKRKSEEASVRKQKRREAKAAEVRAKQQRNRS